MTPFYKRFLTRAALVLLVLIVAVYAWLSYGQSADQERGLLVPQQGRDAYKKSKDPLRKFEKDMKQRVEDAKSRGVDLTKEKPVTRK